MTLVVYTDYSYRAREGVIFGERAFVRFLGALAQEGGGLRLLGRLDQGPGPMHYALGPEIEFVALPHYARLTDIGGVARSVPGTLRRMWRALDDADTVFSLGPQPHSIALAVIAVLRRRRLVLGVRQDYPAYVRHRHPGRRYLRLAAWLLEGLWRGLARFNAVVVVGPDLARRYRRSRRLLEIAVSLITAEDVRAGAQSLREYDGAELTLLTVGRLDAEKDPLLVADVLAALRQGDRRWRLVVCGEGDLADALRDRIEALELSSHCELRGYVALHGGLLEMYRSSHVFLHVSRTEGLPQVLLEAYASGLPSVATAVGGVRVLGDCSVLVEPSDAGAAAAAVHRLASDSALRERLVGAGLERAGRSTLELEARRLAEFLSS